MDNIIDFGKTDTWPPKLQEFVFHFSNLIADEKDADRKNIESGKAHYRSIEMPTYDKIKSKIEELLLDSSALAWHCTNLINPQNIKRFGLRPLTVDLLKQLVREDLSMHLKKVDQEKILEWILFYQEEGHMKNKENRLWFLLNREIYKAAECKEFLNFFGGEQMRRIIENELCEYIAIFQSVGKPYLVEFHVELNQIETFQLSNLADQLINFGIDSLNREKTPFIYAEGKITKTIGPDRILKIYPV